MRPSFVLRGKHFGKLTKMYGQYTFSLSPNEQSAFKGFWDQAFVRVYKEYVWNHWYFYTPPAVITYLLYDWAKKANYEANRKDPAEYANDV